MPAESAALHNEAVDDTAATIRALPEHIVNRIAAGEVIERPASVIKELVENALDAGATAIDILIAGGGKSLIRVRDDGRGMTRRDLLTAVLRHRTSKLPDDDLSRIVSLGFRGEALAAIGAVSRMTVASRSRVPDAGGDHGWEIVVNGGDKGEVRPARHGHGTTVEIRDLFFATPARLKFLRTERAEGAAAIDMVRRLALVRPDVSFVVADGDRPALRFAATGDFSRRLADVMGRDFLANSVVVDAQREGFGLIGHVGLPTFSRANGLHQFFSVNGRPVRDRQLAGALRAAYGDLMPRGRFPVAALDVDCPPDRVDVNVHPAKAEVRFRDPGLVRGLIVGAVREVLAGVGLRTATPMAAGALAAMGRTRAARAAPASPEWRNWASPDDAPRNAGFGEAEPAAFSAFPPGAAHVEPAPPVPAAGERRLPARRGPRPDPWQLHRGADG